MLSKVNKKVVLLQKFQHILSWDSLLMIYKAFVRPQLDYGDVAHAKVFNESFKKTWLCSMWSLLIRHYTKKGPVSPRCRNN